MENREHVRCLIVGSGPAGYTAAIYAGRANLSPVEYCGIQTGGQLTQTTVVENFPGYPEGVDGNQMMQDLRQQALRFGVDMREGSIAKVDFSKKPYVLTTDTGAEIEADTVIIATGASAKYLGLDDEKKYNGQGVSACATCDGFFYRKRTVAVVGGGDTACEEALYLAGLCKKVYMIVRKPYLRASDVMRKRVEENEKIEILYEHNTLGLFGEDGVEGAHLVKRKGEPTRNATTLLSTASSSLSAISRTPTCSARSSTATRPATSRPSTERHAPTWRACSLPATAPTRTTARLSWLQAQAARLRSRLSAGSLSTTCNF